MKKLVILAVALFLLPSACSAASLTPRQVIEQIMRDAQNGGVIYNSTANGTQAVEFAGLNEREAVEKIGELCRADMERTGLLASVSAAQFIVESNYGKSQLAQNANNCFGMKCNLSGNTWPGSAWDGVSRYVKQTGEEAAGAASVVTAEFRQYASVEDSVADHSAYLLGATDRRTGRKRYEGLYGERDYVKAIQIIKDGGYATSFDYVSKICAVIERYGLTRYDEF